MLPAALSLADKLLRDPALGQRCLAHHGLEQRARLLDVAERVRFGRRPKPRERVLGCGAGQVRGLG